MELPTFPVGCLGRSYEICYCTFGYNKTNHDSSCYWNSEPERFKNLLPEDQEKFHPFKIKMTAEKNVIHKIFAEVRAGSIEVNVDLEDYCTECSTYEEHLNKSCFKNTRSEAYEIAVGDLMQKFITENLLHVRAMLQDQIKRNKELLELKLKEKTRIVDKKYLRYTRLRSYSVAPPEKLEQLKLKRDKRIQGFCERKTKEVTEMTEKIMNTEQLLIEEFIRKEKLFMECSKEILDDHDIRVPVTGPILKSTVPPKRQL